MQKEMKRSKGKDINSLNLEYVSQSEAWMDSSIFDAWLKRWDYELTNMEKKVILILDNFSAHFSSQHLTAIELIFPPLNTTSVLQPLDGGIIANFKHHFSDLLSAEQLNDIHVENVENLIDSIDLYDALKFVSKAWEKVTATSIQNCWQHCGYTKM